MTNSDRIPPMTPTHVFFLIYDGFEVLDLSGPAAVFAGANTVLSREHYVVRVLSCVGGPVRSAAGLVMMTEAMDSAAPGAADTLFVVGAGDETALARVVDNAALKDWLITAVARVHRFGSFCLGAFVLANAGLVAEKRVATHWAALPTGAASYSDVEFDGESLYAKDQRLWTSAGATTGIDMALAMVAEDLGRRVMGQVAERLVVSGHRHGDAAQRSRFLAAQVAAADLFPELPAWLDQNLDRKVLVSEMAARVGMSERNFYRKFVAKLGVSPSKFLETRRLERAQGLLSEGLSVKATAAAVGYASEAKFRVAYHNRFGVNPSADGEVK